MTMSAELAVSSTSTFSRSTNAYPRHFRARCGKEDSAELVILVAPGVLTGNMQNMTQDVAIGKDADQRWGRILDKRAQRDKFRREIGKNNLKYEGGYFKPNDKQLQFVETPEPKPEPKD